MCLSWAEETQGDWRRSLETFGDDFGGEPSSGKAGSTSLITFSIRLCGGSSWVLTSEPASSQRDRDPQKGGFPKVSWRQSKDLSEALFYAYTEISFTKYLYLLGFLPNPLPLGLLFTHDLQPGKGTA